MDRNWYLRLSVMLVITLAAAVVLWPTAYFMTAGKHTIRAGETLQAIASQHGVRVDRLRALNELEESPTLEAGEVLRIPGWFPIPDIVLDNIDRRITPGLDIQGGLRMMYTVDMDAAVGGRRNARAQTIVRRLGEKMDLIAEGEAPTAAEFDKINERVRSEMSSENPRLIRITFTNPADRDLLDRDMVRSFGDLEEQSRTDNSVTFLLSQESIDELRDLAVNQAQETIKNRIQELGIQESNVRAQDIDIIVEVPGASEAQFDRIRDIISQTAQLQFQIVDDANTFALSLQDVPAGISRRGAGLFAEGPGACPAGVEPDAPNGQCTAELRLGSYVAAVQQSGRVPDGRDFAIGRANVDAPPRNADGTQPDVDAWQTYVLYNQPPNGSDPVGGEHLDDARVMPDGQTGQPVVTFSMNAEGARRMQELTGANLQKQMAIVLDGEVQSAPVIRGRIGAQGQIELGGFRDYNAVLNEANDLVVVLRAGALPAPIVPQNEQLIGPTLGQDSVIAGMKGALAGIAIVLVFMGVYYSVGGLIANAMVLLNIFLLFGTMAFFNNDLTLPGIAGIALTVGMAVDANVLINERMREELRIGKGPRAVVDTGYRRAFWAIFDGQLTTAIAGIVLIQYGSPEIQGFGRTLLIGIVTSLFTSVFCSRIAFDWLVRGLKVSRLRVG